MTTDRDCGDVGDARDTRGERALDRMVAELRDEPTPGIDWQRVEARLLARIGRAEVLRFAPRTGRSTLARIATFAAAAAVIALGLGAGARRSPDLRVVGPAARVVDAATIALVDGGDHDLQRLRVGDAIETGVDPVTFAEAGSVRWTLEPASRAVVRALGRGGVGYVVALEGGSLRAEVVPRDASEGLVEAFAVEVGGTRIAVHGTRFTVAHAGDHAIVDVDHGAVAVGPVGHVGATTGRLLVGPSRARFSLDGGRSALLLPRDEAVEFGSTRAARSDPDRTVGASPSTSPGAAARRPERAAPAVARATAVEPQTQAAPTAPAASPSDAPAASPSDALPQPEYITEASVLAQVERCRFEVDRSPIIQSVSSVLTVQIRADGTIEAARFVPPLKGGLHECVARGLRGRFEPGPRQLSIPVVFGR